MPKAAVKVVGAGGVSGGGGYSTMPCVSDRKHGGGNKGLRKYCCSEERRTSKVGSA